MQLAQMIDAARSANAEYRRAAENDDPAAAELGRTATGLSDAIIAYPVQSLADVRAKAVHLLAIMDSGDDPLEPACLEPLLRSLAA